MSDPSLSGALWETAAAITEMGARAAANTNDLLADHPPARPLLITALAALLLYWFIDGIWNYQRQCLRCHGLGAFQSRLSKRRKRPCRCCGGTGSHVTLSRRLITHFRRSTS